jgi:hypothetical protein
VKAALSGHVPPAESAVLASPCDPESACDPVSTCPESDTPPDELPEETPPELLELGKPLSGVELLLLTLQPPKAKTVVSETSPADVMRSRRMMLRAILEGARIVYLHS